MGQIIRVEAEEHVAVDSDEVLSELSAATIVKHFVENDDLDALLDAIGVEDVKRYFNLVEKPDETQ